MLLTHEQRRKLVDLLLRVPPSGTFQGRTALLSGFEHSNLNRDQNSARVDLEMIVSQLVQMDARDDLVQVIDTAISFVGGTPVEKDLDVIKQQAQAAQAHSAAGDPQARPALAKQPLRLFISYADEDRSLLAQFEEQLSGPVQNGTLQVWHRGKVQPGDRFEVTTTREIKAADVIVALVSASYLATRAEEADRAVARKKEGVRLIPVRARAVVWAGSPFEGMAALPAGKKPVASWKIPEEAWAAVVEGILKALKK